MNLKKLIIILLLIIVAIIAAIIFYPKTTVDNLQPQDTSLDDGGNQTGGVNFAVKSSPLK